jgi:hypothetical protein
MPYAANVAVEVGGVCVMPGDYVCVDSSGGVVIPAKSLRRVLDTAHQVAAEDDEYLTQLRDEHTGLAKGDAGGPPAHAVSTDVLVDRHWHKHCSRGPAEERQCVDFGASAQPTEGAMDSAPDRHTGERYIAALAGGDIAGQQVVPVRCAEPARHLP